MAGIPIHPAVVHIPIGVAVLTPLLAVAALAALWRGRGDRRTWGLVALAQAVVLAGALVALRSGETEEERVEDVVAEQAIERHEERAEAFTWLAGVALAAGAGVLLVPGRRAMLATAMAATVASSAVSAAAFWVGHSGGELVYRHGAAQVAGAGVARPEADDD